MAPDNTKEFQPITLQALGIFKFAGLARSPILCLQSTRLVILKVVGNESQ